MNYENHLRSRPNGRIFRIRDILRDVQGRLRSRSACGTTVATWPPATVRRPKEEGEFNVRSKIVPISRHRGGRIGSRGRPRLRVGGVNSPGDGLRAGNDLPRWDVCAARRILLLQWQPGLRDLSGTGMSDVGPWVLPGAVHESAILLQQRLDGHLSTRLEHRLGPVRHHGNGQLWAAVRLPAGVDVLSDPAARFAPAGW